MCKHCGTTGGKADKCPDFCKNCRTAEDRKEMCKANKLNNPKYECKICGIEKDGV